ncbi:MAG: hypothetical protein WCO42_00600 [bacterium]
MKLNLKMIVFLGLIMTAAISNAGSVLSVRLVEASHAGQGMGTGLGDVSRLLLDNLPFKSFQMLASRSMSLPADGVASLSEGIVARCTGSQETLKVVIERGGKAVMQTTVALRDGTPLIIGGISTGRGKMIVILLAK